MQTISQIKGVITVCQNGTVEYNHDCDSCTLKTKEKLLAWDEPECEQIEAEIIRLIAELSRLQPGYSFYYASKEN